MNEANSVERTVLLPVNAGTKTTPRERPILFSAPMVRAILDGTKTQTRRALAPDLFISSGGAVVRMASVGPATTGIAEAHCPYWRTPGDRLWVRETWARDDEDGCVMYRADVGRDANAEAWEQGRLEGVPRYRWRPSIFMPRWASRITLEVTGVRVEWLRDISRGDAMAEGCPFPNMAKGEDPRQWYADLWNQINGPGAWDDNPHVWVIEFRRLQNVEVERPARPE
jgi:hypothetical protein